MRQYLYLIAPSLLIGLLLIGVTSCITTKRVAYFQNIPDSVSKVPTNLHFATYSDPIILPGDILAITLQTIDKDVNGLDASSGETSENNPETVSLSSQKLNHYQVDKSNVVFIPILGKVNTGGLSTNTLRDSIQIIASKYFRNPIVDVRLINFTITVLGEVNKPGNYILTKEKISVLDALAIAGDMTIYGKKDNVMLVRNAPDAKLATRLDLNSTQALDSPYFYLKQGDVIFVEADKAKITALKDGYKTRNYTLIASGLSVLIILLSRLTF